MYAKGQHVTGLRYHTALLAGLALLAGTALTPAASAKSAPVRCQNTGAFTNIKVSGGSCQLADKVLVAFTRNPPGAPGCSPTASMCSVSLRDGVFKYEVQPALPVPGKLFFFGQPPKYKGVTVTATTSH
jgi:hypothetical protein